MNTRELAQINFHGDQLIGVLDQTTNDIYAPVKPICNTLGLNVKGQQQRIRRHRVLSEGGCIIHLPSFGGDQETFCLRHDLLPLWLTTISVSRVKPELQEKLYLYQKEAAKVLAEHFLGRKEEEPFIELAKRVKDFSDKDIEEIRSAVKSIHPSVQKISRLALGFYLEKKKGELDHGELEKFTESIGMTKSTARKWRKKARESLKQRDLSPSGDYYIERDKKGLTTLIPVRDN